MKGRTTCPECKHVFVLDVPDDCNKFDAVCPKCNCNFTINTSSPDSKSGEECHWEEHGEPRKTILSSVKPKTNKPMIAAILLIIVFIIGVTTAVFSEAFIESSTGILSDAGMKGTVEISVQDINNESLENVSITLDGKPYSTNKAGALSVENVTLGIKKIKLSLMDYKTQTIEILVTPFITAHHEITMNEGDGKENNSFDSIGCSIIFIIFSVFALLAAISSYKRQHLDVSIAGSIIGIFTFGFFLVGSILCIIAFILIMLSREEFENGKKGKIF